MTQDALIGQQLGPYRIDALVGSGGMARVYRAFDTNLHREVAVKVLSQGAALQADLRARFQQEARLIARLRHPHIVQVYDFGEENGLAYMVEELLPGPSLGAQLRGLRARGERMGRDEIVAVAAQLASALDAAHAAGIVHRDVKPDNAIWGAQQTLVLTDFGIARPLAADTQHTQAGTILGTPYYLAPEQARGQKPTFATDVYALGVVLYELLAGQVPFPSPDPMAVLYDHIQTPPPPLGPQRPDLPPAVEQVVLRALSKEPTARFASAGELARALAQAWLPTTSPVASNIHNQPTVAWEPPRPAPPISTPQRPASPAHEPRPTTPLPPVRVATQPAVQPVQRRGWMLPLLGGLLLLLGLAAFFNFAGRSDTAIAPTPVVEQTVPVPPTSTATPEASTPTLEPTPLPVLDPLAGGRLAFASDRVGSWQIVVQDATEARDLTGGTNDYSPDWSPDGQRVVFHSGRAGNDDIYVVAAEGGDARNLTNAPGDDREPVWSPDGRRIAFASRRTGNWEVYVMNADSSDLRQLTNDFADDFLPAWSPDGRQLAFTSNRRGNDDIWVISVDGSNERQLTEHPAGDKYPAWSPDGSTIIFEAQRDGDGEIYAMDANGGNQRNLSSNPGFWDTMPSWSPDGRRIAFVSDRDGNNEIYIMGADGSNPQNLSRAPSQEWDPTWAP
jgi:eukaryotic-like serine/threonine-protein kinase